MRLVIQRVKAAAVSVADQELGSIGTGLLVLLGFGREDSESLPGSAVWRKVIDKLVNLRIFPEGPEGHGQQGRMNRSLEEVDGEILLVSQFTLYADVRKGRRPGFDHAARPDLAETLYERFVLDLRAVRPRLQTGSFGAEMDIRLVNWGPVTLVLDANDL
jgi:D-aminoacyl-tRNA deacylase